MAQGGAKVLVNDLSKKKGKGHPIDKTTAGQK
jgi:hypothetical protein